MSIIAPRPIGWIGSVAQDGVCNLAPFSFFNLLSQVPPLMAFCANGPKHTHDNISRSMEFTWSLVTRDLAEAMNMTSAMVPANVDEFALAGLTPKVGKLVAAPMVAESPVGMECRVTQIITPKTLTGEDGPGHLIIGQIVGVHISHSVLKDGIYDLCSARPVQRAGGSGDYFETKTAGYFHMPRPQLPT